MNRIDHFMYAVPSLDLGITWARDLFGVEPAYGGEHLGLGTRNALLSLDSLYLEIIAPDPAQDLTGNMGERLAALSEGGMVTWAAEGNLTEIATQLGNSGRRCVGPNKTERKQTDGHVLTWELLFPIGSEEGGRMPFFIDWLDCQNPKDANPLAGEFKHLKLSSPFDATLKATMGQLGLNVDVIHGESDIQVTIDASGRQVILSCSPETRDLGVI